MIDGIPRLLERHAHKGLVDLVILDKSGHHFSETKVRDRKQDTRQSKIDEVQQIREFRLADEFA